MRPGLQREFKGMRVHQSLEIGPAPMRKMEAGRRTWRVIGFRITAVCSKSALVVVRASCVFLYTPHTSRSWRQVHLGVVRVAHSAPSAPSAPRTSGRRSGTVAHRPIRNPTAPCTWRPARHLGAPRALELGTRARRPCVCVCA